MQHESIDGVVVRVRDYGDHDRYLSVLTAQKGRITLLAKGSRSLKGAQTAVSQLYTYANFEYYRRGDFNVLKGGSVIHPFYGLSLDIDRLDLAAYLCELTCEVSDEGEEASELLRLLLNSLFALSHDLYPQETVKGAFELRTAALAGYSPDLGACAHCGRERAEHFYLHVMNGALLCPECLKAFGNAQKRISPNAYDDVREAETLCMLPEAVLCAWRYCMSGPLERLFSFELKGEGDLALFSKSAETYLLSHLGRGFDSLQFYHTMREHPRDAAKKETKP
ncbi:MAG: DNA repair protein RecO [Clostridia bacterium]|nr:DNA repair protein RecO [Clostridia bacterium]